MEILDSFVIFFMAGIRQNDKKTFDCFFSEAIKSGNARLISVFENIKELNIDTFIAQEELSPDLNDALWTLYFSPGKTKYLE